MEEDGRVKGSLNSVPLTIRCLSWIVKSASYITRRSDGTVNRRLSKLLERKVPASEQPSHGIYTRDVVFDNGKGLWVRLFVPVDEEEKFPVIVYFHGGGFCSLSAGDAAYDELCRRMARRYKALVVSVEYRLAPEHKCPAAYEDSFAALWWLSRHASSDYLPRNADVGRCYLMGDSAGGNIVHHVGCRVAEAKEDLEPLRVVGHVLIQPYFGGEERTPAELNLVNAPLITTENSDWYWRAFLPEGANKDHPVANVVGPNAADISSLALPPTLVVVGGLDILQDWQMRYFHHLKRIGKDVHLLWYQNAIHAFHLFPGSDLPRRLLEDLTHFMLRTCFNQPVAEVVTS